MSQKREHREQGEDSDAFLACEWPPPAYANPDGFSEINVAQVTGPGDYEATDATLTDRISLPPDCVNAEVAYTFGAQGDLEHLAPFILRPGDIRGALGEFEADEWENKLDFYPDRNEAVVLHNANVALDYVRCRE